VVATNAPRAAAVEGAGSAAFARRRGATPIAVAIAGYVPLLFSILTAPMTARALGPSGKGLVALVIVINEVGSSLFRWGLPEATAYHLKLGAGYPNLRHQVRRFVAYTTPVALVLASVVVMLPVVREQTTLVWLVAFTITAWSPLVDTTSACIRTSLMAAGDLTALRNAPLLGALPFVLVIPMAYALGVLTAGVVLCTFAASTLIQRIYLGHRARRRLNPQPQGQDVTLSAILRYGTKAVPAALSNLGNSRLDQLLVVPLIGLSQLGIYSVAITVGMLPVSFGMGLSFAAFKGIPATVEGQSPALVSRAVRLSIPPLVMLTLLVALPVPVVVPLVFGSQFEAAVIPCLLLLPGALAMSITHSVWQTADALGRPGVSSIAQVLSLVVTVVLLMILLPSLGIAGAAIATSVAYLLRLVISMYLLGRIGVKHFLPQRGDVAESIRELLGRRR
jgi:O-antigen/teichoic acid export membrane protein